MSRFSVFGPLLTREMMLHCLKVCQKSIFRGELCFIKKKILHLQHFSIITAPNIKNCLLTIIYISFFEPRDKKKKNSYSFIYLPGGVKGKQK